MFATKAGWFPLTAPTFRFSFLSMADFDELYGEVGRRLRQARVTQGLSQEKLARQLGISRASVVNIEAGRQRAPLHLLWQFSEALGTDLSLLVPRREELLPPIRWSRTCAEERERHKTLTIFPCPPAVGFHRNCKQRATSGE